MLSKCNILQDVPESLLSNINLCVKPQISDVARVKHEIGHHRFILPDHWAMHLYEYNAQFFVRGHELELYPGCLTLVPPGTPVDYFNPSSEPHIHLHFQLPAPLEEGTQLPIQFDLRGDLFRFEQTIISIGRNFLFHNNILLAEIKLWDLIWELYNFGKPPKMNRHPSLEKALSLIDARLGEHISIENLAKEVGVSRNHLTRLFQTEKGTTVVAYVRERRARRAKHLLESTTIPVSNIAAQVHSPNLQSFSALVKQETGHPPSYWRRHCS